MTIDPAITQTTKATVITTMYTLPKSPKETMRHMAITSKTFYLHIFIIHYTKY